MDYDVLPGPSLPELARTALARAASATVSAVGADGAAGSLTAGAPVPVRSTRDGSPLLLPAAGSPLARWLSAGAAPVRVSLPAQAPYSVLRLTGTARPAGTATTACVVTVRAVEFTAGGLRARATTPVAVGEYAAARPDPLWRVAPSALRHLEQEHREELARCVRAHGLTRAEWVVPTGLDRYGLQLLVVTTDGVAAVRLSFPDGPVSALGDVPVSLRAALTCRCAADPGHGQPRGLSAREGRD